MRYFYPEMDLDGFWDVERRCRPVRLDAETRYRNSPAVVLGEFALLLLVLFGLVRAMDLVLAVFRLA